MTARKPVVIHHGRTFNYDGIKYRIGQLGPLNGTDGSYEIFADGSGMLTADGFDRIKDVRAYINQSAEHGWPLGMEGDSR